VINRTRGFFARLHGQFFDGLPPLRREWSSFGLWFRAFSLRSGTVVYGGFVDLMKKIPDAVRRGVEAIREEWGKLRAATRDPVNFVIRIYNEGVRRLVNRLADFVGIKGVLERIPMFRYGGVLPGYAPGKDRLLAAVSPGESIFRPEFTRAVGAAWVHRANEVARRRGPEGVREWLTGPDRLGGEGLAFARGGVVPGFAGAYRLGGIIDNFLDGVRNFTIGNTEQAARTLLNKVFAGRVPGTGRIRDVIAGIPDWIKGAVLGWIKKEVSFGGPRVDRALAFARAQAGKPYVWGGVGPHGYDCSGLWSAIVNVIHGRYPYSRLFSTHSFSSVGGPGGFVRDLASPVRIGITHAGVGHMAGTIAGVNIESRGSAGVVIGRAARGFNDGLFTHRYGMKFDSGGWLPTGISLVYNGTGRPEPVLTEAQWDAIAAATQGSDGSGETHYHAHFDGLTQAAFASQVRTAFTAMEIAAGRRTRPTRRD